MSAFFWGHMYEFHVSADALNVGCWVIPLREARRLVGISDRMVRSARARRKPVEVMVSRRGQPDAPVIVGMGGSMWRMGGYTHEVTRSEVLAVRGLLERKRKPK